MLHMAAKMCPLASITKDPKIHSLLKDPPRLYAHFLQHTRALQSPPLFSERGRSQQQASRSVPATKGKADRVFDDLLEMERQRTLGQYFCTRAPHPFFSWIFNAWHCAHPPIIVTVKAHSAWKTLRWDPLLVAQNWHSPMAHFHNHSDPRDTVFISNSKEVSSDPESIKLFSQALSLNYKAAPLHFMRTDETNKRPYPPVSPSPSVLPLSHSLFLR